MDSGIEKPRSATAAIEPAREPQAQGQRRWGEPWRRVPRGFLGMLALLFLVEFFLAVHEHDYRDVDQWNFFLSRRQAGRARGNYDVVCLGDSVIKMAVIPKILESKTGLRTYNMAVCGSQAPETFFLLRRLLQTGARPAAIVVTFFPRLQELGPWHGVEYWRFTSVRDTIELCFTARDATLFGVVMSKHVLPSYALRRGIRTEVMGAFKGQPGSTRKNAWNFRMMWAEYHGAQLLPANTNPTEDFVKWQRDYFGRRWFDPTNVAFIHRFLKLAAAHQIPVFWLLTPVKAGLQAQCEQSGYDADYTRYLQAVRSRFPNVTVVDARHSGMERDLFFDPHHLGKEGAQVYSVKLAEILDQQLNSEGKDGWVQLVAGGLERNVDPHVRASSSAVAATNRALQARRN